MSGKLVVLDGIDGSGKATQTKKLLERLRAERYRAETLAFPQYEKNFFGQLIRRFLDGEFGAATKISPYISSVLYAADRFESSQKIKKWLKKGKIVILDRYVSANQIHQGSKIRHHEEREKFLNWLDKMEFNVFGIPRPDLVIYLDVAAETAKHLMAGRQNHDQAENDLAHQNTARRQSLDLLSKMNNWIKIACEKNGKLLPIDTIHEKVWAILKQNAII